MSTYIIQPTFTCAEVKHEYIHALLTSMLSITFYNATFTFTFNFTCTKTTWSNIFTVGNLTTCCVRLSTFTGWSKTSVHLAITLQSPGVQRLFYHPV